MKIGFGHRRNVALALGIALLALVATACSTGSDETVDLLEDPKIGLAHLNAELHTVKGEELLASPTIGLAHLNEEMHTVRELATDPKLGFEHLNAELHAVKEMLAELALQVETLQK